MKTWLCVFVVVLGVAARRADACDQGGSSAIPPDVLAIGAGYAVTTATFAIGDVAVPDHGRAWAIGEIAFNTPASLLWGAIAYNELGRTYGSDRTLAWTSTGLCLLHAALVAHGIYTLHELGTHRDAPFTGPPGAFQVGTVKAAVSPIPIRDGAALGLSGVF